MSVTRRIFLGGSVAGFAGIPLASNIAPIGVRSLREQAIWHMRELERLTLESGAGEVNIVVLGDGVSYPEIRMLKIRSGGSLVDSDGMFALEGGAA